MSGRYIASHIPCRLEVHVPDTTKSVVNTGAPIKSIPERKTLLSCVKPATTGSQNQGANLQRSQMKKSQSQDDANVPFLIQQR